MGKLKESCQFCEGLVKSSETSFSCKHSGQIVGEAMKGITPGYRQIAVKCTKPKEDEEEKETSKG